MYKETQALDKVWCISWFGSWAFQVGGVEGGRLEIELRRTGESPLDIIEMATVITYGTFSTTEMVVLAAVNGY